MLERDKVVAIITDEISQVTDQKTAIINENTPLMGDGAVIDSQGILTVLLALEDLAMDERGAEFDWSSNATFSSRNSPLLSVGSLADFFIMKVEGK
ncbi:hypothetical protein [Ahrensia sp. 13_GOM-1096m]|uniref:hypothetical protein n=1 Tax=Ahrensia sp. 13_GOM-1096m TaxID=1380380 RepID=UPI000688CF56|nr:hypothetical protein [Ahrensia sp. 13_GOM-1096m]